MTNANCIRVLTVDDHPLIQEGISTIINCQTDMSLAGTASNNRGGLEAFRAFRPDVTLMDLCLPDRSGLDVIIAIRSEFPDARIIVFTSCEGDISPGLIALTRIFRGPSSLESERVIELRAPLVPA